MSRNKSQLGLVSSDGFFQPIALLNASNLEYACKSLDELLIMLRQHEELQHFEQCSIIRDEIAKRVTPK